MHASNEGLSNSSSPTGPPRQPPHTTPIRPQRAPIPSWVWASLLRAGYTRCALGRVILRLTPRGRILRPTPPARYTLRPPRPSSMPSYPPPPPSVRDPASSKGSQTWLRRPQSGPTSSCSLTWLSSFAPLPLVSPLGCPRLLPPSTPLRTPSFSLPPSPPLALKTSFAVFTFLDFSYGCFATLISHVGGTSYDCFFY